MTHQAIDAPEVAVAIVGLGPVGALLAGLLAAQGLRVTVFDRAAAPSDEPRAAHLDDDAMRILQAAGVADHVAGRGRAIDGMDIVDAHGRRLLRARKRADSPSGWPTATLVHQPDVEGALIDALRRFPEVDVRRGHEVVDAHLDDAGVTLRLLGDDGQATERFAWAVGCDGARSTIRRVIGARMVSPGRPAALASATRFSERWLVVDAELRENVDLPDRLIHFADPLRPATYVPFAGRRRRWEFRLLPDEDAETMTEGSAVAGLLRPHVDPELVDVRRAAVYSFAAAVARPWRRGRVLIAGDAAHVMPPFIGQGLCSGFRDAAFLGWALPAVARDGADPLLLDRYEAERAPHAREAVRLSVRAGRAIGAGPPAAALRDASLAAARRLPAVRRWLDDFHPRVATFRSYVAGTGVRRLQPIPQPWVVDPDGRRARLDDVLGNGWSVIGLGLDPGSWAGDDRIWRDLAFRFVRVHSDGGAVAAGGSSHCEDGDALTRWAGQRWQTPVALVVRPDRFLFAAHGVDAGAMAAAELRRTLGVGQ